MKFACIPTHIIGLRENLGSLDIGCFDCQIFWAIGVQPTMAVLPDVRIGDSSLPAVFNNNAWIILNHLQ